MSKEFEQKIALCMLRDQHSLRRELARDQFNAGTQKRIEKSIAEVESRRNSVPAISFPSSLPVSEKRDEIAQAIHNNQIVIIAGETGSGKTTQIPKICLELGLGVRGLIGHTQPRRLAARAVATRIAEELGQPLGQSVGYQVRFDDVSSPNTLIKLMTDGILLAEIQQDRFLNKYEVIIIDEAHERSLNIDFLMGYLKRICQQRPDLKVIITSATIDVEKFSTHFSHAPVISVSGRTYPVDIIYQDPVETGPDESDEASDDPLLFAVLRAINTLEAIERQQKKSPGDILIFLSGERDIRELALALRKQSLRHTEILPLYARLTQNEQQKIFASHTGRRIVLSTNVAETSLTVPGIRYVIDSGLARISRYSIQSKVQRLPIEPISQASANQRAGRCGRVSNGICIRLYSEQDFLSRPLFTDPEIQRTNLSAVILQMLQLRLGEIHQFPFVEPPEMRAINDGFKLLDELGAITRDRLLTENGRLMARLPTDPRLARMLLAAGENNCLYEMLIIVSALSVQDPRDTPSDKKQAAREKHQQYAHTDSDFLSWVVLWDAVESQRQDLSQSQFRKFCQENFLSWMRLREWRETHRQLSLACQQLGLKVPHEHDLSSDNYEAVHRSILAGSLNQLGFKSSDGLYTGSRGRKFSLFPSSALFKKAPRWIVTAELIETSRLFATVVARIEPEWAVDVAEHLLRREHFDVHWEKKRGEVVAFEKISLFGLVLIEKRPVSFAAIDPKLCREIFIRQALVEGELLTRFEFFQHNQALIDEIRKQEEKERKPDILVSDDTLFAFYNERLPESISGVASLQQWYKKQSRTNPDVLKMQLQDVVMRSIDDSSMHAFPDQTTLVQNALPVKYKFEPGSDDDGVSIDVPLSLLNSLEFNDLEWAVPGLVHDRCVAMIKSLPKSLRKNFVPVPDFVAAALAHANVAEKPALSQLLSDHAWRQKRIRIDPGQWDYDTIPLHLRPRVRVLDKSGKQLAVSSNLRQLKSEFGAVAVSSVSSSHPLEKQGFTDWDFEDIPTSVELQQGVTLLRYPAIRDDKVSVSIQLCDTRHQARMLTQNGIARLLILKTPQQKALILKLLNSVKQTLGLKLSVQGQDWQENALLAIYRLCFQLDSSIILKQAEFNQVLSRYRSDLIETAERLCRLLKEVYESVYDIRRTLSAMPSGGIDAIKRDIDAQLEFLIASEFPASVPDRWLWEYPRYLNTIRLRLDKGLSGLSKELECMAVIAEIQRSYEQLLQLRGDVLPDFPWLLQELRVSLYAQALGTRQPVSAKRLTRMLELARMGDIH